MSFVRIEWLIPAFAASCFALCFSTQPTLAADPDGLLSGYQRLQNMDSAESELYAELMRVFDVSRKDGSFESFATALGELPFWNAGIDNNETIIKQLLEAQASGIVGTSVTINAIRNAKGQLDDSRGKRLEETQLDVFARLTDLRKSIDSYPLRYQLLVDHFSIAAAEAALFESSVDIINQPISTWREQVLTDDVVAAATEALIILKGLISEYSKDDYATGREQYFLNDLRYRSSLIHFIIGSSDWPKQLLEIGENSGSEFDWYKPGFILDHVYINKFFNIDDTEKQSLDAGSQKIDTTTSRPIAGVGILRVRQNYNPVQLAAWTCETFWTAMREDQSIAEIYNQLKNLENADYLVVLGHYDGSFGRFSNLPSSELRNLAEEIIENIPANLSQKKSLFGKELEKIRSNDKCAPLLVDYPITPQGMSIFEGAINEKNRYYAIRGVLDSNLAREIESFVKENFDGRLLDGGPYLLRPGTNG